MLKKLGNPVVRTVLAIVIVDMQMFFLKKLSVEKLNTLLEAQIAVIRICASCNIPIIVLEYKDSGETVQKLDNEILLVKQVVRLIKNDDDGFYDGQLHEQLLRFKANSLLLMGVNTSYCVKVTASSALSLGYKILTGDTLTTNTCMCCRDKINPTLEWYARNGHVFRNTPSFEEILKV